MADAAAPADEAQPDEPAADAAPVRDLPSLSTRVEWFEDWEERTRDAQKLARIDRDYYDGKQWTDDELAQLAERGQPPIVKNRIAKKVNTMLGEEIDRRIDPVARPRTPQHEDATPAMTDALRYVEEEQDFDVVRSALFKNVLVEGYGGALKSYDPDTGKHELVHVQWDRLFYDPHSRAVDFSDAKYKGLVVWMDIDDAIDEYPDAADDLRAALANDIGEAGGTTEDTPRKWVDKRRDRIKIVEMYFRVGADWYRAVFTKGADIVPPERTFLLDELKQHSVCPLVMVSCYVDQEGNRYGVVRNLISPQDEINKRASKALHQLSVRQVIAERDVVRQPNEFMTEIAKPDGFAEVEPGTLQENRILIKDGADLAQGHVALMQQSLAEIDAIGPAASNLPSLPESSSGRAFIARTQAAAKEHKPVFDALRSWSHEVFELDWLCIRQYWTEEKWLRITDDETLTGYRFVALNRQMSRAERLAELLQKQPKPPLDKALRIAAGQWAPIVQSQVQQQHAAMAQQAQAMGQQMPKGEALEQHLAQMYAQHPAMMEPIRVNDVEQMLVDIVIDEAPDTAVLAQEEFATLTEMAPTLVQARPDMAGKIGLMLLKASQLPNKRQLIEEWEKGPDPEKAAMQKGMQQLQQQMAQLQAQLLGAQVQKTQADAQLSAARAQSEQVGAQADAARVPGEAQLAQAKAQREFTASQLEAVKVSAEAERDRATAVKHSVDAQARVREMMTPEVIVAIPRGDQ